MNDIALRITNFKKAIEWHCLDDQLTLFLKIWGWSWTCFSWFEFFPKPSGDQFDLETKTLNTSSPKRRKHCTSTTFLASFHNLLGNEKWRKQRKHQHATSQLIDWRHFQKLPRYYTSHFVLIIYWRHLCNILETFRIVYSSTRFIMSVN